VRRFLLLLLLLFAFVPVRAQEVVDADEDELEEEDEDDGFPTDDEMEVEDYSEYDEDEGTPEGVNERVKSFDVGGVTLDMDYDKVREAAKDKKFVLYRTDYNIPEYMAFNYDAVCRERNVYLPEAVKGCIEGLAKKDKMHYVSQLFFKKNDTSETMEVFFTSPVTGHIVWKVEYNNEVNKRVGTSKNFQYQRDERRRAFWYNLVMKYGEPNVPPNRWVLDTADEFSPELAAEFGKITLQSQRQRLFDVSEATKEARRRFKYKDFSF
jgi:hypothetical protein